MFWTCIHERTQSKDRYGGIYHIFFGGGGWLKRINNKDLKLLTRKLTIKTEYVIGLFIEYFCPIERQANSKF